MSKRNLQKATAFVAGDSPQEAADAIFGSTITGPALASDRIVARPISIFEIAPDPAQPRRVVPSLVRSEAAPQGSPNPARWLLNRWIRLAWQDIAPEARMDDIHERLRKVIAGGEPPEIEDATPALSSLLQVVALAQSIRRDGLTNPITVSRAESGWVIETGERRWWAYRLLNELYQDEWTKIPAREVERVDVWRQATENNARQDLNAIGRARQYAILVMHVVRQERPIDARVLLGYDQFSHEQDYYAQAAGLRVPSGWGDQLAAAMGLKNRGNLSQYKSLLKLPREYWERGDDENWSRDDLIKIVSAGNNLDGEIIRPASNLDSEVAATVNDDGGAWENLGYEPPAPPKSQPPRAPEAERPPQPLPEYYDESPSGRGNGAVAPAPRPAAPVDRTLKDFRYRARDRVLTAMGEGVVVKPISPQLYEVRVNGKPRAFRLDQLALAAPEQPQPESDTVTTGTELGALPWRAVGSVVYDAGGGTVATTCNAKIARWIADTANLFGDDHMQAFAACVMFAANRDAVDPGLTVYIEQVRDLLNDIEADTKFAVDSA